MPVQTSDQKWVAQAATGDESAFRELYLAHVRPVYWIAHGLLGSPADAEDVTQETFVTAWRKLPGLELQSESLLPWLAGTAQVHSLVVTERRGALKAWTVVLSLGAH